GSGSGGITLIRNNGVPGTPPGVLMCTGPLPGSTTPPGGNNTTVPGGNGTTTWTILCQNIGSGAGSNAPNAPTTTATLTIGQVARADVAVGSASAQNVAGGTA